MVLDVVKVLGEPGLEGVLGFTHVSDTTMLTADQVDQVFGLRGTVPGCPDQGTPVLEGHGLVEVGVRVRATRGVRARESAPDQEVPEIWVSPICGDHPPSAKCVGGKIGPVQILFEGSVGLNGHLVIGGDNGDDRVCVRGPRGEESGLDPLEEGPGVTPAVEDPEEGGSGRAEVLLPGADSMEPK